MKITNEMTWKGRKIIVDTCEIDGCLETIVAYASDWTDLEILRTKDEEEARENHRRMVEKYTETEPRPLSGRYAKLQDALEKAREAAGALAGTEDGGTCNFDSVAVRLPRWTGSLVERSAELAGCFASRWESLGAGWWTFSFPGMGQGNRRTRMAEAMRDKLAGMGYEAGMYYQMD